MRRGSHEGKDHSNFMTEKEKAFVENYNRRNVLNALHQKEFSIFFDGMAEGPVVVARKEKKSDTKAEETDAHRNLFTSGFTRSKKKPRILITKLCTDLPHELETAIRIEEFCVTVLKIRYRYSEVVVPENSGPDEEYDPGNATCDQGAEYRDAAVSMLEEEIAGFSQSQKFLTALEDLYECSEDSTRKSIVLAVIHASDKIEFTPLFKTFLDKIFHKFPAINKGEVGPFYSTFSRNSTGITLATILMLKNPEMSKDFKAHVDSDVVHALLDQRSSRCAWQFLGVMASSLDAGDKRDVIVLVRKNVGDAIGAKDRNVDIFLRSIGVSEDDLK